MYQSIKAKALIKQKKFIVLN